MYIYVYLIVCLHVCKCMCVYLYVYRTFGQGASFLALMILLSVYLCEYIRI